MGMYTRLTFWAELSEGSPAVPAILALQAPQTVAKATDTIPDHPFFEKDRAWAVLNCSSYYHQTGETVFKHDNAAHCWFLNIDSSLKNYSGEIPSFLDWLSPYDVNGATAFRGFYQYEEDEHPTLIYRVGQQYRLKDIGKYQSTLEWITTGAKS